MNTLHIRNTTWREIYDLHLDVYLYIYVERAGTYHELDHCSRPTALGGNIQFSTLGDNQFHVVDPEDRVNWYPVDPYEEDAGDTQPLIPITREQLELGDGH